MAHIKISMGTVHIEYEGEPEFIESKLLDLVERTMDLVGSNVPLDLPETADDKKGQPSLELSTNTISQIIGVKTGSELALAAIAKINLVKNKPAAARQEILDEMKEASTYYRDSYASNLTAYLSTLVRSKRVNLISRGAYALAAAERARLDDHLRAAG